MAMRAWVILVLAGAAAIGTPVLAAEPERVCTAPGALSPDLQNWAMLGFRDAAATARGLAAARLVPGEAVHGHLQPADTVRLIHTPEKAAAPGTYSGMWQITVASPGTWRVVLGTRAWIDMIGPDGQPVASAAHEMGPACTGIRKIVEFPLQAGTHTIQIVGSVGPDATIMVVPKS